MIRRWLFPEPWMRWYDLPVLHRLARSWFTFTRDHWHSDARRLARFRALYWVLIRRHDTEICRRCGGPVRLVYIVPDAVWEAASGYGGSSEYGESAPGVLCPPCLDDLARVVGLPFLRWTCFTDDTPYDAWVAEHPKRRERAEAGA